jgi:hypothetical protein
LGLLDLGEIYLNFLWVKTMNILSANQTSLPSINLDQIDLIIAASGYEQRATHIPETLRLPKKCRRFALGFNDRPALSRSSNDRTMKRLGYDLIPADGSSTYELWEMLTEAVASNKERLNIIVDYSSMTRIWYATIINFFRNLELYKGVVTIHFTYSLSTYSEPKKPGPNVFMGPIPGYCQLDLPNRETALVIGLGYERDRALGLAEYVDPAVTYAIYADPALDPAFPVKVRRNNRLLLYRIGEKRTLVHPMADLETTDALLCSLCMGLKERYRVILAPLGPKPFSLLCLLLGSRYPYFDVWRVSAGEQDAPSQRIAIGETLVCSVQFINDDINDRV